ncbi:MAG: aldo/keto reductase [Spirochaetaceae bacterium]|nr:MAG: aldo/keto reductase [Spirochaetaceae bacterium]
MIHREPFGNTDFRVSDIVLGTWKAGGTDWGPQNDLATVETIKACIDSGVNLIDTATGYGMGHAERLIGYALDADGASRREEALVMTKWYLWMGRDEEKIRDCSPAAQAEFLKGSKARLGQDPLDIVLLHRDDQVTPIETAYGTLAEYQAAGDVRYIGVSNYSLDHLKRAQAVAQIQNYQVRFSLLDTEARDDGRLDFCIENNVSVGVFSVLGQGWLAPRLKPGAEYPAWDRRHESHQGPEFERMVFLHRELQKIADRHGWSVTQLALAWVLSHPAVTFAIVGASTPSQVEHNLAVSGKRLSKDEIAECEALVKEARKR